VVAQNADAERRAKDEGGDVRAAGKPADELDAERLRIDPTMRRVIGGWA